LHRFVAGITAANSAPSYNLYKLKAWLNFHVETISKGEIK